MPLPRPEWYQLYSTGHFGYPQPEDTWESAVYDTAGYCPRCGIGGVQRRPFRFRSEPKASHSQFIQLNWVFDEFFVRPEVRPALEMAGINGASFGPALRHRTVEPLAEVEQLIVLSLLPGGLVTEGLQTVTCKAGNEESSLSEAPQHTLRYPPGTPYCGRVKYHHPPTLRFRAAAFAQAPDLVKSAEWFGSGGEAFRAVLASARVVALAKQRRWRGLKWKPVELIP